MKWVKKILFGISMVLFGALAMIAFGYLFMRLWNWLIPELFNGPVLTFWQGVGLLVLSKIVFGHHGRGGKGWRRKCCGCSCSNSNDGDSCDSNGGWNKWKGMSFDEKREMKEKWKAKCKDWANEYKSKSDTDLNNGDHEKI